MAPVVGGATREDVRVIAIIVVPGQPASWAMPGTYLAMVTVDVSPYWQ